MCNSKVKAVTRHSLGGVAQIDGRAVLQPTCNRVFTVDPSRPLKKSLSFPSTKKVDIIITTTNIKTTAIIATTTTTANKRGNDPNSLNSTSEKPISPKSFNNSLTKSATLVRKKSKKSVVVNNNINNNNHVEILPLFDVKSPGSLAAAQREQATLLQAQRKMRIAHYGRVEKGERKVVPVDATLSSFSSVNGLVGGGQEEKKCFFLTPNSDPMYVAYHDEEWGVPVHDDKLLFELLVLSGAQVGLDWTTILKKREAYRSAFLGFDAEEVSKLTEKQMASISVEFGIDLGRVRGVVDNSNRVLEVRKQFGSLDKYFWAFVNHKPISNSYRSCRKIPVKTSKSEAISKDMVRRGFRFVGPTIVHSFMQAAGLTNDHLVTCPRHTAVGATIN